MDDSMEPNAKQIDRLFNAVLFFAAHTRHCGAAKVFRLLYLLDVLHFQQTGATVTGEQYRAWNFGPAPDYLYNNLARYNFPLRKLILTRSDPSIDFYGFCFEPAAPFARDNFTPRQEELLARVSSEHASEHYGDIDLGIDNDAYAKTWAHGRGKGAVIELPLTMPVGRRSGHILERHREQDMMAEARRRLIESFGNAA